MFFFAALTLAVILVLWQNPFVSAVILGGFHIIVLVYLKSRRLFFTYLFGFMLGPLAEVLAILAGAWTYTVPQFFGIPVWLPFLWGAATLTAGYFVSLRTKYE
jgi:hypothetical protein